MEQLVQPRSELAVKERTIWVTKPLFAQAEEALIFFRGAQMQFKKNPRWRYARAQFVHVTGDCRLLYFPFGFNGMLAGSGIVFFSYAGFDAITGTAKEVKKPQRDLPLGLGIAVFICYILYMRVSLVIVLGLIRYNALDPDTPISSAFASYGMKWEVYIITTGAVTTLCAIL